MINFIKHVLFEYCTFFMNMSLDAPTTTFAKSNFYLLVNVKTLLGLNAIMPLLEVVYSWSKFPTMWCVCVWFHSIIVNFFERDEYKIYCDNHYYFQGDVFENFHVFINFVDESINV
jgi:hypothetical protein